MLRMSKQEKDNKAGGRPHVKKNDTVLVTHGKDRGKQGKVLRVNPTKGTAIVERVNFTKKHTRKNPAKNIQGGIAEREAPIQVSNLRIVCPSCGKPTRVGSKHTDEGRVRVCKKCESEIGS